jgi:NAD(P)-dependent dehydrogenase (short-subunit alcohol dehydrogenase family)
MSSFNDLMRKETRVFYSEAHMLSLRFALTAILAIVLSQSVVAQDSSTTKAVLVTGASSGIGLAITQYLAGHGFYVYAGARKDEDLKRLNTLKNVSSVRLDVTKQADVDAAVQFVSAQGRGLFGVINNAGVASLGDLTTTSDEDVLWQYDINVMGPLRVNRAFFPLLKQSKGRTAIIGSLSAFLAGPGGGGYGMSKAAAEIYTETLALELAPVDVKVGIIDPGAFKSRGREKVAMKMLTGKPDLDQQLTAEQMKVFAGVQADEAKKDDPTPVAEQTFRFLTSDRPRLHYMAANNEQVAHLIIRTLLDRTLQLNASQTNYTLNRDQLVKMIDAALAQTKASKR